MKLNEIYLGDCLDIMPNIPDESVDMILADLPFGTTKCKWDSVLIWKNYGFNMKELLKQMVL
jgi:site-specific DNA-methyltransferase (adenine-specific)